MKPFVIVATPTLTEGLEIRGWLDGLDGRVDVVESAREVVRWAHKERIDLLIVDTALPEMEGTMLVPLLREIQPELPIIVTTGRHTPALEQEVRRSQVVFYAIRPDDLPNLGEVVRKNLNGVEKAPDLAGGG